MILFLILFSSCSITTIIKNNNNKIIGSEDYDKIITNGDGLIVDFKISEEQINQKKIRYTLNLKNTGLLPIKLSRDNFKLITTEIYNDGEYILTEESINNFYENLFKNGDITLITGQEINNIKGILYVDKDYFENINNQELTLKLKINYDYETKFNNNLEINLDEEKLKFLNPISQAAPIIIENIKLNLFDSDNYEIGFYLKDKSKSKFNKRTLIEDFNANIGSKILNIENCKIYIKNNQGKLIETKKKDEIYLTSNYDNLIIACPIQFNNNQGKIFNTFIKGSFKYKYEIEIKKDIQLPKQNEIKNW